MMCNIFSFIQDSTQKYPEKVYVVDKEINWTYSDIYQKTIALAKHINSCGTNRCDRILIYLDNSVEYIAAFFSVLLVNGVVVPINKNTTVDNIQYIVNDTSTRMIISNDAFLRRIHDKVDFNVCKAINIDLIFSDTPCNSNVDFLDKLSTDSNLPAMILYTSGTTRIPKGVTLTHKNLLANTNSILEYLQLTPDDSILATINFSYSYGNSLLLTHTKIGGKIIIENRIAYPIKVIEQLYSSKATGFSTVGSYLNILLKQDSLRDFYLKHLRYMTFAGESTNFDDLMKLDNLAPCMEKYVMYGQTEASARLSYLKPSMLFKKPGSIGKGIPGVTLRVVTDDGKNVEPGEIGEIIAYGDNIMKGYWNNEVETKSVIKDGWLYTGDLATVDEDGYIYVKGRKDDIIKYLGHRISPVEVESAINSCEHVLESAVIQIENNNGKQIKACIVPKNDTLEMDEINAHIKKHLPPFKRPHIIEFIHELPRTTNGKIKRSELRKLNS